MMKFVDIHGHYAWGIDDGIVNREMALAALRRAKSQNYQAICCTPHVTSGKHTAKDIERFKDRIDDFKREASVFGIDVYQGSEIFLNSDYQSQVRQGLFIPYASQNTLLVEFDVRKDMNDDPDTFIDCLYELTLVGYRVVLAHVERYFKSHLDLDLIDEALDLGVIMQVNTSSLLSSKGPSYKNAYTLLQTNRVHVIASDTHRDQGMRSPNMQDCYDLLKDTYDQDELRILFYDNPLAVLQGHKVQKTHFVKKGLFKKKWMRDRS